MCDPVNKNTRRPVKGGLRQRPDIIRSAKYSVIGTQGLHEDHLFDAAATLLSAITSITQAPGEGIPVECTGAKTNVYVYPLSIQKR